MSLKRKRWHRPLLVLLGILWVLPIYAGPVIMGGDDLTSHGSRVGTANVLGWLYIEKAIGNILNTPGNITRPGNDGSIAALGSASTSCPPTCPGGNAGAAIGSVAAVLGKTVTYYEGAAAISGFLSGLGPTGGPAMIWLAGEGASNDLDLAEGAALTANAGAIAAFVSSGGGLMAHGSGATAYGWLTALLPGLIEASPCSIPATLTAAGMTAFPGLTNADISAGPCHSNFSGSLGSLVVLALDSATPARNFIIGGGAGTILQQQVNVPTLSGWMLVLLGVLIAGTAVLLLARRA